MIDATRHVRGRRAALALAFAVSGTLGGCADIWGFQDSVLLQAGPAGADGGDATVPVDANGGDDGSGSCGGSVCVSGQRCVNDACVCDVTSCPTGCCANGQCESGTSPNACGTGGSACSLCPTNQTCTGGACSGCAQTCTTGCCTGATCTGLSKDACGPPGTGCVACDPTTADNCTSSGTCKCGASAPCAPGQACLGSQCVCNSSTCPSGCCDATQHCQPISASACAPPGGSCLDCFDNGGDTCNQGQCQCGGGINGQLCGSGAVCDAGTCVCNPSTCPAGCCQPQGFPGSGEQCAPGTDDGACGTGGAACQNCHPQQKHCQDAGCQ